MIDISRNKVKILNKILLVNSRKASKVIEHYNQACFYPRNIRLIQHFQIKSNSLYQETKQEKIIFISIDTEKYLTEFTIHSLLKQNKHCNFSQSNK